MEAVSKLLICWCKTKLVLKTIKENTVPSLDLWFCLDLSTVISHVLFIVFLKAFMFSNFAESISLVSFFIILTWLQFKSHIITTLAILWYYLQQLKTANSPATFIPSLHKQMSCLFADHLNLSPVLTSPWCG